MPSKESKVPKYYPPCNRAFALRMMNPTAYSDNNVSPFDQEIKPLPTKRICKGACRVDSDGNNVSFDENSNIDTATLSPVSSLASLQDMDLNDIDGDTYGKGAFTLTRAKSVIDSFGRTANNGKQRANTVGQIDSPMARCHTALGEVQPFQRHDVHRMTTPARASTSLNHDLKESLASANGCKQEGRKCLQDPKVSAGRSPSASKLESKGLSRTPSLRERSRAEHNTVRPRLLSKIRPSRATISPNQTEYTENLGKHSDALRSQERDVRSHLAQDRAKVDVSPRTAITISKSISANAATVTQRPSGSDLSESDNSIILSEADAYNPANNPRRFPLSGHSRQVTSYHTSLNDSASGRRSLDVSTELSGESTQRSLGLRRSLTASSPLPNGYATGSDLFSQQLADVCHLMSEKHPGEFQILESLVNMQAAYEAKELQHRETLRYLQEKIEELEKRMERSERRRPPSMSAIILPLAKATTAFQKQLEDILSICDLCVTGRNATVSVQTNLEQSGSANDISMEANAVAEQIRRVCINRDADALSDPASLLSTDKLASSEQLNKKDPGNQSILHAEKYEN